jgi:hypothetical protein
MSKVFSIYLIAAFLYRALTAAHEFPSPTLRNMTIGLDLLCLIGLIGTGIQFFKNSEPGESIAWKVLFWIALVAGLGLFAIRLNGTESWWTGHLRYYLLPRS